MNHACYTVCSWIAMAQNEQEMPWASQQQLAHNSRWEKQGFNRLLFLCLFSLSTSNMNEFVTDYIVDNVVTHVQGFASRQCCNSCAGIFKWNFDHFLWETVSDMNESGLMCGSCAQLTRTVHILPYMFSEVADTVRGSNYFLFHFQLQWITWT